MAFSSNEFLVVLYSYWTKCLIALWAIIGTLELSFSIKWKAFFSFCHWKKLRTCLGTPFSSARRSILLISFNSIFYQGFSLIVCSVCHVTSTTVFGGIPVLRRPIPEEVLSVFILTAYLRQFDWFDTWQDVWMENRAP